MELRGTPRREPMLQSTTFCLPRFSSTPLAAHFVSADTVERPARVRVPLLRLTVQRTTRREETQRWTQARKNQHIQVSKWGARHLPLPPCCLAFSAPPPRHKRDFGQQLPIRLHRGRRRRAVAPRHGERRAPQNLRVAQLGFELWLAFLSGSFQG